MSVPAWDKRRVEAGHILVSHYDILEHLVESSAEVNVAVGVWRSVVKHKFRLADVLPEHIVIDVLLFPLRKHFRLALGKIATHGEFGFG